MMDLPSQGRPVADVLGDLEAKRSDDVAWADGRTFGMVYDGGPSVHEVIDGAARMFLHDNALNTQGFRRSARSSPRSSDGPLDCSTDRRPRPGPSPAAAPSPSCAPSWRPASGTRPNAVSINPRWWWPRAPTPRSTRRPTSSASPCTRRRWGPIGGSTSTPWPTRSTRTPSWWWARRRNIRRGWSIPSRRWLGGFYASPNLQGTRSGLPMASAWAVMQHLGADGYCELTRVTLDAADRIRAGVAELDRVQVLGDGDYHLIALAAAADDDQPLDMFALGDALGQQGWFHDRQTPPDSLHSTVSNGNVGVVDDYLTALRSSIAVVGEDQTDDRSTNYATLE